MGLSAAEFLAIVERDHQVPQSIVDDLRRQIATAPRPIEAASVAKFLVDKGHLPATVALQVLSAPRPQAKPATAAPEILQAPTAPIPKVTETAAEARAHLVPPAAQRPVAGRGTPASPAPQSAPAPEEELGLAPDEDDPPPKPTAHVKLAVVQPVVAQPAAIQGATKVQTAVVQAVVVRPVTAQPVTNQQATVKPAPQVQPASDDELGLAPDEDFPESPKPIVVHAKQPAIKAQGSASPASAGNAQRPSQGKPATAVQPSSLEDDLGLLADDDPVTTPGAPKPVPAKPVGAVKVSAVQVTPVQVPATARPAAKSPKSARPPAAVARKAPLPVEGPMDWLDDPQLGSAASGLRLPAGAAGLGVAEGLDSPALVSASVEQTTSVRRKTGLTSLQRRVLLSSAAVAVVLIVVVMLASSLSRSNGYPEFEQAEKEYEAKEYQAAVEKFTDFLRGFEFHQRAATARAHLGMARLRLATADKRQWTEAMPAVRRILDEIVDQREFPQLHAEVAPLLTEIAETLTDAAAKAATPQETRTRVVAAREAFGLVNDPRFVPPIHRDGERLQEMDERLTLLEYQLDRSPALEAALADMKKAIAAHDLGAAHAIRRQLVQSYPDLARTSGLLEMGRSSAADAAGQVHATREPRPAVDEDARGVAAATLVLAGAAEKAPGTGRLAPCFALAEGALYALDAGSGQVLWRRYLGGDADLLPVATRDAADVLLVDARDHSLLRVEAGSGKLRWRQVVGQPLVGPTAAGKQIFVATHAGLVMSVDETSGESAAQARLPQPIAVSPAADAAGKAVYVVAEHSHLYTLTTADLACRNVTYLGHEPGTIEVSPLVLPRHLIVAENRGMTDCVLRVVALDGEGVAQQIVQNITLVGQVVSPPASDSGRIAVATDRGAVYVFEVTERADIPLKKIAELPAMTPGAATRYLALESGQLWIADAGLRCYSIAALGKRSKPVWRGFDADVAQQPLQLNNNLLVAARRTAGMPGIVISGTVISEIAANGGVPAWETRLAAPPCTPCTGEADDDAQLVVARCDGAVYRIDVGAARGLVRCQPAVVARAAESPSRPDQSEPISACLPLADNKALVLWSKTAVSVDPSARTVQAQPLPGPLLCPPASAAGGVFAVCQPGEVCFLGSRGALGKVASFLPVVRPADLAEWSLASVMRSEPPLVLAARGRQLYCVGIETDPISHLATQAVAEMPAPLAAAPAASGKLACTVDRDHKLQAYALPGLSPGAAWNLGSRAEWGPKAVGSVIVVATDDGQLHCVDQEQRLRWKIKLAHTPIVGACARGEQLTVAARDGVLARYDLRTGDVIDQVNVAEPLRDGPIFTGGAWIVVSADGCLLKVPMP